jgi:hypothetical protein
MFRFIASAFLLATTLSATAQTAVQQPTAGAPAGSDPSVDSIVYYALGGNLAIFYKDAA